MENAVRTEIIHYRLCLVLKVNVTKNTLAALIRVRPRFFDQHGHEIMYASSGNKHFCTNPVMVRPTNIMNRADKDWAQFYKVKY